MPRDLFTAFITSAFEEHREYREMMTSGPVTMLPAFPLKCMQIKFFDYLKPNKKRGSADMFSFKNAIQPVLVGVK